MLTTLVLSLVVSLLLAASGAVAVSHYSRSTRETDYAAAIQAADAGVNWQLREISLDPSDTTKPCQASSPCSRTIPGTPATFTVFITNEDGVGVLRLLNLASGAEEPLPAGAVRDCDQCPVLMPIPAAAWGALSGHGIWYPVNLLAAMALPHARAFSVTELEQFRLLVLYTAWLIDKGVCVVGADSWGVEVVPNPDKNLAFPCHGELITKNGIFLSENMQFADLLRDRKYQFVYVFVPVPIKGATGSPGCPIAIT